MTKSNTLIEEIGGEYWITTYFNDGYTRPNVWNKTFRTRKAAENYLQSYKGNK